MTDWALVFFGEAWAAWEGTGLEGFVTGDEGLMGVGSLLCDAWADVALRAVVLVGILFLLEERS